MTSILQKSISKKPELREFRKVIKARRIRQAYLRSKTFKRLSKHVLQIKTTPTPSATRLTFLQRFWAWFRGLLRLKHG